MNFVPCFLVFFSFVFVFFTCLDCSKRNWKKSGYFDTTHFELHLKRMHTFEEAIAAPNF